MDKTAVSYPIDNSAILFLSQMAQDHTNVYRLTVTMAQEVESELLQQAVNRICSRFPTIVAGFQPDAFRYRVVPAAKPPRVQPDPGFLHTMTPEEIKSCACRVYYSGNQIFLEAFHALTDGYGILAALRALLSEYIFLRYGVTLPEREELLMSPPDWEAELSDGYEAHCGRKSGSLPRIASYRIPGDAPSRDIQGGLLQVPTQSLRQAAKAVGVSVTTLLSVLMAEAIMELQLRRNAAGKKPVRIMVPIDLRRQFPSRTFRNFVLYALPTLTVEEAKLPRLQRLRSFQEQLHRQTEKKLMQAQITRNVKLQKSFLFRGLPISWKRGVTLFSNRLFGESNSSITLTNLGPAPVSAALREYVLGLEVYLTPRRWSPYNCGLLTWGDTTSITLTRFGAHEELEKLFFGKLRSVMAECAGS